jgi:plasmid stabilization system protein ParE
VTDHYRQVAGVVVARKLVADFARVTRLIHRLPEIGTLLPDGRRIHPLRRFPYSIVYRLLPDAVKVVLFRHQRRHPAHGARRR